jgi:hypothetical protein
MTDTQRLCALRVVVASSVGVIKRARDAGSVWVSDILLPVEEQLEKALTESYPEETKDEHN